MHWIWQQGGLGSMVSERPILSVSCCSYCVSNPVQKFDFCFQKPAVAGSLVSLWSNAQDDLASLHPLHSADHLTSSSLGQRLLHGPISGVCCCGSLLLEWPPPQFYLRFVWGLLPNHPLHKSTSSPLRLHIESEHLWIASTVQGRFTNYSQIQYTTVWWASVRLSQWGHLSETISVEGPFR